MTTNPGDVIRDTIRRFIARALSVEPADDDNLFESGLVNSLFAVQLVTFIEKTFSIEVATDDLEMENFKSISATAAFVERKSGAPPVHHSAGS